jgi:hypothetical protein
MSGAKFVREMELKVKDDIPSGYLDMGIQNTYAHVFVYTLNFSNYFVSNI